MIYSLLVVQPRMSAFLRDERDREDFAIALASGARWKVLGLCGVIALSGAGLLGLEIADEDDRGALWLSLVGAKAALLAVAVSLFVYVSWRLWPARLLAHVAESPDLPILQRRFRLAALGLTLVVTAGFVLGVVADSL